MKMNRALLLFVLTLLAPWPARAGDTPKLQLTVETNWPALSGRVVDLFVPPTRLRGLFVATPQQVFRFEETRTNWVPIYTAAAPGIAILGINGYAKASSVLYVAHVRGIARTRDDGESWLETVPPDYSQPPDSFVGVSVNPTNRREAALAFRSGAWLTRDFGESFNRLTLPAAGETLLDIAYVGADTGVLVFLTERALHLTTNGGESWVSLPRESSERAVLAASAKFPAAVVATDQGALTAYDLSRPGFRRVQEVRDINTCEGLATDCAGRGLLWAACGSQLRLFGLTGEHAESLASHQFEEPIRVVREHPRLHDQVFCAASGQILLARVDGVPAAEALTNLWHFAAFSPGPQHETKAQAGPGGAATQAEIQELLYHLAAVEPTLNDLLSAALKHARYSDKEITRWKKRARARNWLPQFRVGAGLREYPLDQAEIYGYVDRFGIPQRNDLRLSDRIEPMGYASAFLVWDLSRLLFDPEEVDINREKRYEITQRNALITQVTTLYYERLDLLLRARLRADKMTVGERISSTIKLQQKTELLNNLCGQPLLRLPSAP